MQREYYNTWRDKAAKETEAEINGIKAPFSVLSFDFAESVHYPSTPQQIGPSYFRTTRKCSIFGVHNERAHEQWNYIINEKDNAGKGANAVISMLHDYLEQNGMSNSGHLILFADNWVEIKIIQSSNT